VLLFGEIVGSSGTVNVGVNGRIGIRGQIAVGYDGAIRRTIAAPVRAPWAEHAARPALPTAALWVSSQAVPAGSTSAPWAGALSLASGSRSAPWRDSPQISQHARTLWQQAQAIRSSTTAVPWAEAVKLGGRSTRALWREGVLAGIDLRAAWAEAATVAYAHRDRWRDGAQQARSVRSNWAGRFTAISQRLPWQYGPLVTSQGSPWTPPDTTVPPVDQSILLHFCGAVGYVDPHNIVLLFGVDPCAGAPGNAPLFILPRSTYMTVHAIEVVTLPGLMPVPVATASLSTDQGSFGWTLNATGPASLIEQLTPSAGVPVQLRVTLDGLVFVFAVEGLQRTRAFGQTGASITGRSITALVGDPYMPEGTFMNAADATAQQLMEAALEFTGVTLDWQITDWLVTAGAWSFSGTPLAAVQRIAGAAGAIVQSHRSNAIFRILPRYPTLPWEWAATTPDVTFPLDPVVTDGWQRADQPAYNGVYVSGQSQGVLAFVKRTGTAGDLQAAMVTDALITHADAARQRGGSILGAAGPQAQVSIELPVLTGMSEPGIFNVGQLVQVTDPAGTWRGLVRGVSVRVDRPSIRQTITVERHL
jgi:hypothetical protein